MGRVDAGALGQRLKHGGAEVLRVHVGQCALALPANAAWRAAGVDDPGFGHCEAPGFSRGLLFCLRDLSGYDANGKYVVTA